jgi:hypothetical protein
MDDITDLALNRLDEKLASQIGDDISNIYDPETLFIASRGAITALRAKVAQLEMAVKAEGKVVVDVAGLPTPSAEFMAAMMPAFEAIAAQEMQKQIDALVGVAERVAKRLDWYASGEDRALVMEFRAAITTAKGEEK